MLGAVVLRSGKEDAAQLITCLESLGDLPIATIIADFDPTFSAFGMSVDYILYIYDNERLTPELFEALPVFLESNRYDYLSLYRKSSKGIDHIPRIFRKSIELQDKVLYPVNIRGYVGETVLNGWLEEIE